jgi:hypothetical protein
MLKGLRRTLLAAGGLAIAAVAPAHAAPVIAQIYGIYDPQNGIADLPSAVVNNPNNPGQYGNQGIYDTPVLFFVNPSAYQITNDQMVLTVNPLVNSGWNTLNNGRTQTVPLGTLNANGITEVAWGSGGQLFVYDYDDMYSSNNGNNPFPGNTPGTQNPGSFAANCTLNAPGQSPQWSNFCAPTGNFQVAFTGTLSGVGPNNGAGVSALFGEYDVNNNYTGWEGLDPMGWSENLLADVHSGTVSGVLAQICIGGVGVNCSSSLNGGTGIPEPITLSVFAAGLAGAAALRRRKQPKA